MDKHQNAFIHVIVSMFTLGILLASSFLYATSRKIIDAVIIRVDDTYVYLSDLKQEEAKFLDRIEKEILPDKRAMVLKKYQKQLIPSMIDRIIVEKEVKKLNINIDERLETTIQKIMKENNITSIKDFKHALSTQGLTYEDFRKELRHRLMQQAILYQFVQPKIVVTHEEMLRYYTEHKDEFTTPVEVEFYQLKAPSNAIPEKLTLAVSQDTPPQELQNSLDAFPGVSLTHFGPMVLSELRKEIRTILEKAEPRKWTELEKTKDTHTWVWLIQKTGGVPASYESVQDTIREKIWTKKAEALQKKIIDKLRKKHYIHIFVENLPEPYRSYYAKSSQTSDKAVRRD